MNTFMSRGAHSLSMFDNDIRSGFVSPLILIGWKGGDVGLHDFRYIATGRMKRHLHFTSGEPNANASLILDMQNWIGDQNQDGMLWYIPKAHLGNETLSSLELWSNMMIFIIMFRLILLKGVSPKYLASRIPVYSWWEAKMEMLSFGMLKRPSQYFFGQICMKDIPFCNQAQGALVELCA